MKRNLIALVIAVFAVGCSSKPAGPTYSEAVAIYQAEVALLDSLEAKVEAKKSHHLHLVAKSRVNYTQMIPGKEFDQVADRVAGMSSSHVAKLAGEYEQFKNGDLMESLVRTLAVYRSLRDSGISDLGGEIALQKQRVSEAKTERDSLLR